MGSGFRVWDVGVEDLGLFGFGVWNWVLRIWVWRVQQQKLGQRPVHKVAALDSEGNPENPKPTHRKDKGFRGLGFRV